MAERGYFKGHLLPGHQSAQRPVIIPFPIDRTPVVLSKQVLPKPLPSPKPKQ